MWVSDRIAIHFPTTFPYSIQPASAHKECCSLKEENFVGIQHSSKRGQVLLQNADIGNEHVDNLRPSLSHNSQWKESKEKVLQCFCPSMILPLLLGAKFAHLVERLIPNGRSEASAVEWEGSFHEFGLPFLKNLPKPAKHKKIKNRK